MADVKGNQAAMVGSNKNPPELPFPEDSSLNYACPTKATIRRPQGVKTMEEWGSQIFPEGKHSGETFKTVHDQDPKYRSFMMNHPNLTNPWALSFQNYVRAMNLVAMQASDTGGEFLEGNNGNCVEYDTSLASRSLRSGMGFDDGRGGTVSTSEAKFESRSGRGIRDGLGEGHGERAAPHHQHRDPSEGARSDAQEHRYLSGPNLVTPASVQDEPGKLMSTPANLQECGPELERLSMVIQKELDAMLALTWEVNAPRDKSLSCKIQPNEKCKLDLLEVYCEENSQLTETALKVGLKARRFTKADGDLSTPQGQAALWEVLLKENPRDVWMSPECKLWGNFSRLNMCRSQATRERIEHGRLAEQTHLALCNDVYE